MVKAAEVAAVFFRNFLLCMVGSGFVIEFLKIQTQRNQNKDFTSQRLSLAVPLSVELFQKFQHIGMPFFGKVPGGSGVHPVF